MEWPEGWQVLESRVVTRSFACTLIAFPKPLNQINVFICLSRHPSLSFSLLAFRMSSFIYAEKRSMHRQSEYRSTRSRGYLSISEWISAWKRSMQRMIHFGLQAESRKCSLEIKKIKFEMKLKPSCLVFFWWNFIFDDNSSVVYCCGRSKTNEKSRKRRLFRLWEDRQVTKN